MNRRKRNEEQLCDRIKLKKVLGLTVCSNAALDVSPVSGLLAYPAGCTVVLFNAKRQTQAYLVNTSRKAFTSVAFSRCGRFVATGECGINPAIKVWELDSPSGSLEHTAGGTVVAEFVDHKYAVTCVAFSPTGKYLVSVGSQHDMIVNVFDWRANLKIASNKISSKVSAVSFAEDGSYFVTVGNRHVKYWYLEGGRKYKDPIPLMGRSAILGDLRDNDFCAVACGTGVCAESTYAITRQGHLVEFSSRRLLDKWVQCRTTSANCICVNEQFILVGCAESIIRIFNAITLEYVTTLPRTHYLGVDVAQGIHINHIMTVPPHAKYPDCIAMVYDAQRAKVSCVYNDHSLYIWDMRDIKRVGKSHSFLYHSTCIWGVETVPYSIERDLSPTLPDDSFVTCSSDDTIRVWGLDGCANTELYRKNIYSKELLKIVYIDDELSYIKDQETLGDKAPNSNSSYDGRNGVRCIKISPEVQHLASGDRSGNIRIYSLITLQLVTTIEAHESEVLCLEYSNEKIERKLLASASRDRLIHVFDVAQNYLLLQTLDDHSSSITSIKFVGAGLSFQMISCGADKSIMFRTFQGNIFLRGNYTSGKTTLYDMEVDSNAKHILTACQDRNIRVYGTQNAKHTKTFKGSHSDEGSLIKLSLDPSGIYVATSCTDKTLAVYDYYSNECMARMYGHSELVTGLKFTNDCSHLISASGDGCIFVWQVPHDMIVTMQARLSQQRLRSGHAPVPRPMPAIVAPELPPVGSPSKLLDDSVMAQKYPTSPGIFSSEPPVPPITPGYKFADVGQLPQWAKRKATAGELEGSNGANSGTNGAVASGGGINIPAPAATALQSSASITNLSSSPSQLTMGGVPRPRGRWAQRGQIDPDTLSELRSNSESPLGTASSVGGLASNAQTSDYNSASSKDIVYNQTYLSEDSSIDSGMETRRELKFIGSNNAGTVPSALANSGSAATGRLLPDVKRKGSLRFETQTHDHDGDVEDISDGERTSSEHGMFYNNISPSTPTDFKVTAMNEDELRKSVRRQKFEKAGLTLSNNGASTGTGTGTSDTEDEGSTPSAENAERSLASTLGGSSENISLSTTNFLQAALPDGPGAGLERGSSSRRSISAKHNTEAGKGPSATPTITKSYTSTKKEELLKVINEAKQKLENGSRKNGAKKLSTVPEVGYRSLRGSHSISDLSLAGNLEGTRTAIATSRYAKTDHSNEPQQHPSYSETHTLGYAPVYTRANPPLSSQSGGYPPAQHHMHPPQQSQAPSHSQHFFHCAAPKSMLQQSCQAMRQVQQHYPPYPHHVGVHQIHPPPGVPFVSSGAPPSNARQSGISTLPAQRTRFSQSGYNSPRGRRNPGNLRRNPSILKHYKSCPVSPVHEEVEWSTDNHSIVITEPKRHSIYADDARNILDMIQSDTERMIDEIKRKYGDLDDVGVDVRHTHQPRRPYHALIAPSNSVPAGLAQNRDMVLTPALPATPYQTTPLYGTMSTTDTGAGSQRAFSEYFIYQKVYHRKVSLSEILDGGDGEKGAETTGEMTRLEEARFLETQRHSSASFFLASQYPERLSQESLQSDELHDDASYCNSLESVLSDESDCKSAPLELVLDKQPSHRHPGIRNFIIHGPVAATAQFTSKSYGSSPSACSSFDFYMQQRQRTVQPSSVPFDNFDVSGYNVSSLKARNNLRPLPGVLPNSQTYPRIAAAAANKSDDIPTLSSKNRQYSSGVNKSLSSDFAQQRLERNANVLQGPRQGQKPPLPMKPQNLVSALTASVETQGTGKMRSQGSSKPTSTPSRTASVVQKFEKNLRKFELEKESEKRQQQQQQPYKKYQQQQQQQSHKDVSNGMRTSVSSGALATQSCLKKVSKFDTPERRATSMRSQGRGRGRPPICVRFNTVSQIKYTPSAKRSSSCGRATSPPSPHEHTDVNCNDTSGSTPTPTPSGTGTPASTPTPTPPPATMLSGSLPSDYGERSFEMYIAENGNAHNDNMNVDSLKLYTKPELQAVVDEIRGEREREQESSAKHKKNLANEERTLQGDRGDSSTSKQCKNIAKKIDIIQKLIEMEERKLEQIRMATEERMRPFECNSQEKGYVKSLTMNFDMLARGIEKDIVAENEQRRFRSDATDGDLCAYARHIKRNVSLPDVLESAEMHSFRFAKSSVGSSVVMPKSADMESGDDEVELAQEVRADSDIEDDLAHLEEGEYGAVRMCVGVGDGEGDGEEYSEHDSEKIRLDCDENDKGNPKTLLPMPTEDSSIRRACSLSDLHMANMGKGGKSGGSGQLQKPSVPHRNSSASRVSNKRNSLQLKGNGTGSAGMVMLPGSDSENEETSRGRQSGSSQTRSNGPIAASRQYGPKASLANNNRRKTTFGNTVGQQDDSSSEETPGNSAGVKPTVPPRPRNLTFDHKPKILNNPNVAKQRGVYESPEFATLDASDPKAQVHNVINKLYTTTQTVMQLHANLKNCEDSLMLRELENAVIMTQNMLTNITQSKTDKANTQQHHAYNSGEQATLENGDYLMMVNNCADLLSNFRMKHKPDDCENNS